MLRCVLLVVLLHLLRDVFSWVGLVTSESFQTFAVSSLGPFNGEVIIDDEDIIHIRLGGPIRSDKARLADDKPLGLPVVLPLGRNEARVVVLSGYVNARDLEEPGLPLETSPRSEGDRQSRQFEEYTESVRFGAEHDSPDEVNEVLLEKITGTGVIAV